MELIKKLFILFLIVLPLSTGCGEKREKDNIVSVSLLPQKFFIDELTGRELDVNVMIPPGVSHATYSPTSLQFQKLSDSKLYISVGYLGYEQAWIGHLKELNPDMDELNLSEKTELIHGDESGHGDHVHEGGVDPHIWMSPSVMKELLPLIKTSLIKNYPCLKDTIEANYLILYAKVEAVHNRMREMTSHLKNRSFLIFHPALTYLARDYGLNQIAIEQDGKEPSPSLLIKTIEYARANDIRVIFIQQEYDVRNAQLVSSETGTRLVQIDPMIYDWVSAMNQLIDNLQENLK